MADEFKTIETQEQLNAIISERLERKESSVRKEYEGFISPNDFESKLAERVAEVDSKYQSQIQEFTNNAKAKDDEINGYKSTIKKYETDSLKVKVALENGLPYQMASRLTGDTEEDIKKDAKSLSQLMSGQHKAPGRNQEAKQNNSPYANMIHNLKGDK